MGEETEKSNKFGAEAVTTKKPRHRKKMLYQEIKKQMEFYFSDRNIENNKHMQQLIENSPEIDLSEFLKFNKIKAMTSNINDIVKALESSELLKVTDCGTKAYRVKPVQQKENSNECTIYVEQLPADVDHNWVIDTFKVYGEVEYVSLPKFKRSRKTKGFAFVEFKQPEAAEKALEAFTKSGCVLSHEMDPANLCSIRTHEGIDEHNTNNQKLHNEEDASNVDFSSINTHTSNTNCVKHDEASPANKPETTTNDNGGCINMHPSDKNDVKYDASPAKKPKTMTNENEGSEIVPDLKQESLQVFGNQNMNRKRKFSDQNEVEKIKNRKGDGDNAGENEERNENNYENKELNEVVDTSGGQETYTEGEETGEYNAEEKKKKHRKRKKKHKKNKTVESTVGVQILPKAIWKSLRNKYLNEQRKKMATLKQYLRQTSKNNFRDYTDQGSNKEQVNFESSIDGKKASKVKFSFTPGVIVKVKLPEPVINRSAFKSETKLFTDVQYVDASPGSEVAYIRFTTTESAEKCIQSKHWTCTEILAGNEEKDYWDKMMKDREENLSKTRVQRKGRDKLLRKAEEMHKKHIWFE